MPISAAFSTCSGFPPRTSQSAAEAMAQAEPTIEDTRKLLEANLFHHELITPEELALRHARSIGKAFEDKRTRGVVLRINSPGGSPVQAGWVYDELKRQRALHPPGRVAGPARGRAAAERVRLGGARSAA